MADRGPRLQITIADERVTARAGVASVSTDMTRAEWLALIRELAEAQGLVVVDPELARTLETVDFRHAVLAVERAMIQGDAVDAPWRALIHAVVEKVLTAQPGGGK